jgi:hypothetical protein
LYVTDQSVTGRTWMPLATAFSSTTVSVPSPAALTELDCTTTVWPPARLLNEGSVDMDSTSPGTGARCGVPFLTIMNSAGYAAA